ncbi:MAG: family 1 encapsulin nanocompartment shell protein [Chloroflexota bacterium]|nr:family 1 encapsulin nanocompartment shell protein [Chloroflexota bacterium]
MANKYLAREDAPITSDTWGVLDAAMIGTAKAQLVGRRLLHIEGPFGIGLKGVPLQDVEDKSGLITSSFVPLSLVQKTFAIGMRDLAAYERDGTALDTSAVGEAAIECARLEDNLIFNGTAATPGLLTVKGTNQLNLSAWDEVGAAAEDIIKAMTTLDTAGFHGPYSLALAPSLYNLLFRRYERGNFSEMEHVKTMATEGIFKAPILKAGGVLLASGRQYASIVLGQDMTIGFIGPAGDELEFSISESLVPLIRQPKSICVLK